MTEQDQNKKQPSWRWAVPFFFLMAVIAILSFAIPLRPTVSYQEKRELAKFPDFSMEALISGEYFNEIGLWYSDTFPGRERWLQVSQEMESFHGYGSIAIQGPLPEQNMEVPDIPEATRPVIPETAPAETEVTEAAEETEETTVPEETTPETEELPPLDAYISSSSVIQIDGSAILPLGFSKQQSDRYAKTVSRLAGDLKEQGVRVISAPPPTSIGVVVDPGYLPMLGSADQQETLDYMHGSMTEDVITVDTVSALRKHKDEYLFFNTDHHWTALGAYYSYEAVCKALDMEPVRLEDCEEMDQGEFMGSLYGKASKPAKLTMDHVISYTPPGDITMTICTQGTSEFPGTMIRDMRSQDITVKYLAFLESDRAMVHIINEDVPEGRTLLIIKDSFGNCFVPYFTQNYHEVYAVDYRKYFTMNIPAFVKHYDVQDVMFAANIMSCQAQNGEGMLESICGYYTQSY